MSVDELVAGREAYARRAWSSARAHLARAEPDALTAEDLRALAVAAYLSGDRDEAAHALARAHTLHLADGDRLGAAFDAHELAWLLLMTGEPAVAAGWVARAQRLVADQPDDAVVRGYLLMHEMFGRLFGGDMPGVVICCQRIEEIGRKGGSPELVALSLCSSGRALLYLGRGPEGLARLDEAMVSLTTGEVSPIMAGTLYCTMIEGCQEIADYGRMSEWTAALTRWCADQPELVAFTGQCAVHRGQILRGQGAFREALGELEEAGERYAASGLNPALGLALYERGEVLRTLGDLDGAEAAYDQAAGLGHEPQPGLSLLWLARGRTTAAAASVRRLLDEARDPVARSRTLGPAAEVFLGAGNVEDAAQAAAEFVDLAGSFGCAALTAAAAYASGCVTLARDDPAAALSPLRRAWKLWLQLGARYDVARTRVRLAQALRGLEDDVAATAELSLALRAFVELGAVPAQREVERLLGTGLPDGLTAREVEVLRLVAQGHTNPQIAAALTLSEKTVARHLSNIFTKTGVGSRTAAAAYARERDLV